MELRGVYFPDTVTLCAYGSIGQGGTGLQFPVVEARNISIEDDVSWQHAVAVF